MNSDDPAVMENIAGDNAFPEYTRIKNKWHWICRIVVRRAVFAKFMQHPELRQELLATGNALLAADANRDGEVTAADAQLICEKYVRRNSYRSPL
jgi:hypothetical protein